MQLTWYGTASVALSGREGAILFDPFLPLPGSAVETRAEDFDGASHIFVTHGHLDHIASLPEIVKRNPQAKVYCTQTPFRTLRKKGIPEKNLEQIAYNQCIHANGFLVRVRHSCHAVLPGVSGKRLLYILKSPERKNLLYLAKEHSVCRENGETVMYEIRAEWKTVLVMGSMNLRDDVEYPENADVLVLPYNGWEDNYPPAVRTIERLKPARILLDHYDDTFPPLTMPLDLSPLLQAYGPRITALEHTKTEIL